MSSQEKKDILKRLKELRPTVVHTSGFSELLEEVIAEIEFLRSHVGAVTRGESFDDIARRAGRQPKRDE